MSNDERDDDPQPGDERRSLPSVLLAVFVVVALLSAAFIVQNGERVPAEFLWFDRQIKLWVAIVASIALGILLDRLILAWWRRARRSND